jgi:hypothetical protein
MNVIGEVLARHYPWVVTSRVVRLQQQRPCQQLKNNFFL